MRRCSNLMVRRWCVWHHVEEQSRTINAIVGLSSFSRKIPPSAGESGTFCESQPFSRNTSHSHDNLRRVSKSPLLHPFTCP
jgi:hypothetical protein